MNYKDIDEEYMSYAIKLSKKAEGRTSPNPIVGSLIVKNEKIIGTGYHKKAGLPHAEIEAILDANKKGNSLVGSTLYVTLEPCCHKNKKTPPCIDRILQENFSRIVIGTLDKNSRVKGKSVKILEYNGIDVKVGVLEEKLLKINEVFFKYITKKIPFVTLKLAATLDGKIATYSGDSKWIGSEAQRKRAHLLRSNSDAVLVGFNTVRTDDPMLNVRLSSFSGSQPRAVVLDTNLEIPLSSKLITERKGTIIFISNSIKKLKKNKKLSELGITLIECKKDTSGYVDLSEALKHLGKLEITSLLVEGGSKVASSFIKGKLVDKIIIFFSTKILGNEGKSMIGNLEITNMKDALNLKNVRYKAFGNELMVEGYFN